MWTVRIEILSTEDNFNNSTSSMKKILWTLISPRTKNTCSLSRADDDSCLCGESFVASSLAHSSLTAVRSSSVYPPPPPGLSPAPSQFIIIIMTRPPISPVLCLGQTMTAASVVSPLWPQVWHTVPSQPSGPLAGYVCRLPSVASSPRGLQPIVLGLIPASHRLALHSDAVRNHCKWLYMHSVIYCKTVPCDIVLHENKLPVL